MKSPTVLPQHSSTWFSSRSCVVYLSNAAM